MTTTEETTKTESKLITSLIEELIDVLIRPEWHANKMPDSEQTVYEALKATVLIASGYDNSAVVKMLERFENGAEQLTVEDTNLLRDHVTRFKRYMNIVRMISAQGEGHALHFIASWPSRGSDIFQEEQKP